MASTPGPPPNAPTYTQAQVEAAITAAAYKYGVPPAVLIATANEESGLNPNEPGGGLFQDIVGGEAGNSIFGGNPENVYNLQLSAENAAQTFAAARKANPTATWGQVAADAQRPQNPTAYANAIDSALGGTNATLTSATTVTGGGASGSGVSISPSTFEPPIPGANPKNFHGIDLSAVPPNELGNAERTIEQYLTKGGIQALDTRITQDFGYHANWIKTQPEVYGVLLWASLLKDPTSAASQNEVLSALSSTNWWKTQNQWQRAFDQAVYTDPKTVENQIVNAQNKVDATANQLGVKLTGAQSRQIAEMYARNTYTPSGTFSSMSGASQEWLDEAVTHAVSVVGKGGQPSDFAAATQGNTQVGGLYGVSSQLFSQLQQVAQQYLMYNPNGKGLLSNKNLLDEVQQQLQHYTGSGSFGSSNFINGVVQQFTQRMIEQSKQMYPSLAQAIDAGTTPQQYVAPMQNLIGSTLGLDPGGINLTDPTWNWAIATPDPKTGVKTALTQDQILAKITSPSFAFTGPNGQRLTYDNTNTAMDNARSLTNGLSAMFGVGGT